MSSDYALVTSALGKRYGRGWALRDCTLHLPAGRVAALVGPNGAGKTTLLHLAVGLLQPTAGSVEVFGRAPFEQPHEVLPRIGFLAQDHPLYKGFTVADTLTLGRKLNPRWDDGPARARLQQLGIPLNRRVGKLSGGQQAQVALAVAIAKQPDLLLLDEPVASLDPLARREFLRALTDAASRSGLTVLLSSHILADLEQVCDYLIILSASRVQLAGDIAEIVRQHRLVTVPRQDAPVVAAAHAAIETSYGGRDATLLLRTERMPDNPAWQTREATLEEIVLAYLSQSPEDVARMAAPAVAHEPMEEASR
ncbi:MAG: ABC transporter, ATP-binding protein [Ktedonobacterales bacterium]|jgi:ABC-2 type transport system ATP-binding protein|nr:MAG: ABC transporter, ATP-binding protein [Ktedonobacterales bacterium]